MQQEHRKRITKNLVSLSTDLDFPALEPYLLEEEIYQENSKLEEFKIIVDKKQQNVKFLSDIKTRGPKAFEVLVKALRHTSQGHIADILDGAREFSVPQESSYTSVTSLQLASGGTATFHEDYDGPPANSLSKDAYKAALKAGECYPMDAHPKGIALIINNETFQDQVTLPEREGTDKDCTDLEKLFGDFLGFLVVKKKNLTLQLMKQLHEEYLKKDHSAYKCFVSVILSHGLKNGICGTDYNRNKDEVLTIEEIVAIIDGCPTLETKPKVIITQACRGERVHKPGQIQLDARRPEEDVRRELESMNLSSQEPSRIEENRDVNSAVERGPETRNHVGADVLIGFPTVQGYAAARVPQSGTWYIQSFCEVVRQKASTDHMVDMLTLVNERVGESEGTLDRGQRVTQTSEFKTTLKKKLFLPPVGQ